MMITMMCTMNMSQEMLKQQVRSTREGRNTTSISNQYYIDSLPVGLMNGSRDFEGTGLGGVEAMLQYNR